MTRFLVVWLLAGTTTWPPSAAVLCIVPGGHVAIEPGPERCDTSAPGDHPAADPAPAALAPEDTCCAPCTDVPIGTRVLGGTARPDDPLHALAEAAGRAPAVLPAMAVPADALPRAALGGRGAGGVAPSAILLDTIVLRC